MSDPVTRLNAALEGRYTIELWKTSVTIEAYSNGSMTAIEDWLEE